VRRHSGRSPMIEEFDFPFEPWAPPKQFGYDRVRATSLRGWCWPEMKSSGRS